VHQLLQSSWEFMFARRKDGRCSMKKILTAYLKRVKALVILAFSMMSIRELCLVNSSLAIDGKITSKIEKIQVPKTTLYRFMKNECNLSLKKANFQPVDRNREAKVQERFNWIHKWVEADMDFRKNCVFLDGSTFHINMKRSMAWSKKIK
jgi:hypothetical protein